MKKDKSDSALLHPNPVLSRLTMDYDLNVFNTYDVEVIIENEKLLIKHSLLCNNLVSTLINKKKATFCSTITVKSKLLRDTLPVENFVLNDDKYEVIQQLPSIYLNENVRYFIKTGVVTTEKSCVKHSNSFGLNSFYMKDDEFTFPKFFWLAERGWFETRITDTIFVLKKDKDLKDGIFKSRIRDTEKLTIEISMSNDYYIDVEKNPFGRNRIIVVTTALAQALKQIEEAYRITQTSESKENCFDEYNLLRRAYPLKKWINSYLKMKDWEEQGFNPSEIASTYKNLELDSNDSDEE